MGAQARNGSCAVVWRRQHGSRYRREERRRVASYYATLICSFCARCSDCSERPAREPRAEARMSCKAILFVPHSSSLCAKLSEWSHQLSRAILKSERACRADAGCGVLNGAEQCLDHESRAFPRWPTRFSGCRVAPAQRSVTAPPAPCRATSRPACLSCLPPCAQGWKRGTS